VVEADELGHQALLATGDAYAPVVEAFGPGVLDAAGAVDRSRLAAKVFADPEALAKLNAIVHPAVRRLAEARFREIAVADPHAVIVYAAAILVETGGYREFDKLILAACSRELQIERAMARPGATLSDVLARLGRQLPLEEKRAFADYVIDTGGTKEETLGQTKMVCDEVRKLAR
jgi:dephospho-CoA kinase